MHVRNPWSASCDNIILKNTSDSYKNTEFALTISQFASEEKMFTLQLNVLNSEHSFEYVYEISETVSALRRLR